MRGGGGISAPGSLSTFSFFTPAFLLSVSRVERRVVSMGEGGRRGLAPGDGGGGGGSPVGGGGGAPPAGGGGGSFPLVFE